MVNAEHGWRDNPEYEITKQKTLLRLHHAIEQVEKDQHLNAQGAMVDALRTSMRCFGFIRHSIDSTCQNLPVV